MLIYSDRKQKTIEWKFKQRNGVFVVFSDFKNWFIYF